MKKIFLVSLLGAMTMASVSMVNAQSFGHYTPKILHPYIALTGNFTNDQFGLRGANNTNIYDNVIQLIQRQSQWYFTLSSENSPNYYPI